jgi:hypothetical protein
MELAYIWCIFGLYLAYNCLGGSKPCSLFETTSAASSRKPPRGGSLLGSFLGDAPSILGYNFFQPDFPRLHAASSRQPLRRRPFEASSPPPGSLFEAARRGSLFEKATAMFLCSCVGCRTFPAELDSKITLFDLFPVLAGETPSVHVAMMFHTARSLSLLHAGRLAKASYYFVEIASMRPLPGGCL